MRHLRELEDNWEADMDSSIHNGGGYDLRVIHALSEMDFLDKLVIGGYFVKEFEAYLEGKVKWELGWVPVKFDKYRAVCEGLRSVSDSDEDDDDDDDDEGDDMNLGR